MNASLGVHSKAKHNQKYGDESLEGDKTTQTLTPVTQSSQTRFCQPNHTAVRTEERTEEEAGWVLEPVWAFWKGEKTYFLCLDSNPVSSSS
jgi:hypothetical protein